MNRELGDRAAYGELYCRYAPLVHGLLLARVGPDHVDDLVQEGFIKAMNRLAHLRKDDLFGGWIAVAARNYANDQYRRARKIQADDNQPDRNRGWRLLVRAWRTRRQEISRPTG
jgi:RNA polymerase sigma factor (sigma-70 family)